MADIENVIYHMKRGKTSSPDKISAKIIKADMETSPEILHGLIGRYGSKKKYQLNRNMYIL